MNPILISTAITLLLFTMLALWWLLASRDDGDLEEALTRECTNRFGSADSRALDRFYQATYRRACQERKAMGRASERTLKEMIQIFNLRNRALEVELERDSTFTITEDTPHADRHLE